MAPQAEIPPHSDAHDQAATPPHGDPLAREAPAGTTPSEEPLERAEAESATPPHGDPLTS